MAKVVIRPMKPATYYNAVLDVDRPDHQDLVDEAYPESEGYPLNGGELEKPTDEHPANLESSLMLGDERMHRLVLDIDQPVELRESATPGHHHLIIPDVRCTWQEYLVLLEALVLCGVVEADYVKHARERKQCLIRLPGVKKASTVESHEVPDF